jgi:regulator of replication initiation timing
MKERMKRKDRRAQLLKLMRAKRKGASNQAEFRAEEIAKQAGITTVLFYRLVGVEFKKMRAKLPGPRRSYDSLVTELRSTIKSLLKENKELKVKQKRHAIEDLTGAIHLIEELERENLSLSGENEVLRERLEKGGHVMVKVSRNRKQRDTRGRKV